MKNWIRLALWALVATAAISTASADEGDWVRRSVPDGWMTLQLLGGSLAVLEIVRRKLKAR